MISLQVKRLLIVNIFGVGDVLFTTPLLANLKKHYPNLFIGYICNRRAYELLETNSHIDECFVYEKDEFEETAKESIFKLVRRILDFKKEIQQRHFDAVIDFSLNKYASFFLWSCGIKSRIGYNYKNRSPFLTIRIPFEGYENRHVVEYYLDFLRLAKVPVVQKNLEIFLKSEEEQWAWAFFSKREADKDSFRIAVVPGGGASWGKDASYKRWVPSHYAELIDKLIEKFKATVILLGSSLEKDLCREVEAMCHYPVIQVAGKTTLRQFAALLKECDLAVVNDGGPLHVAVAVGTPTVSIFGPVDERVYGPYPSQGHKVITAPIACRPCYHRFRIAGCAHHRCLSDISPEDVFTGVNEIITQKYKERMR